MGGRLVPYGTQGTAYSVAGPVPDTGHNAEAAGEVGRGGPQMHSARDRSSGVNAVKAQDCGIEHTEARKEKQKVKCSGRPLGGGNM